MIRLAVLFMGAILLANTATAEVTCKEVYEASERYKNMPDSFFRGDDYNYQSHCFLNLDQALYNCKKRRSIKGIFLDKPDNCMDVIKGLLGMSK